MVTAIRSPSARKIGGLRAKPTPGGVPVRIRVPGSRVVSRDRKAISSATLKIMSAVLPVWTRSPFKVQLMARDWGSGISSAVTSTGPRGQKPSKPFPRTH